MAYDEGPAQRLREALQSERGISEQTGVEWIGHNQAKSLALRSTPCRTGGAMKALAASLAAALLFAVPAALQAQQTAKVHRIGWMGFLDPVSPENLNLRAFRHGLRELGYVEGKHVLIEARSAEGREERVQGLVAELLGLKIDVLVAGSTPVALAARQATTAVPIVFAGVLDPVGSGIVANLARPGSNITGITVGIGGLGFTGKCLELLKEAVPGLSHVAVLLDPAGRLSEQFVAEIQVAARTLNVKFDVFGARNATDLEKAFAAIGASSARGIFVMPGPFLTGNSHTIAQFAANKRLPAFHFSKRFPEAGGLMSYGASLESSYQKAATYVDKILKGAKPAELPVEQPTRFELVINLRTAKAMGLRIPQSVLLRADHIIE